MLAKRAAVSSCVRLSVCMPVQAVSLCMCSGIRSWIRQACPALRSALCTVFPFKSGRLAHAGSLGFSCCQLSEPWQAVLRSGGAALGSQPPPLLSALLYLVYYQIEGRACDLDCDAISLRAAATFTLHRAAFIAFNLNCVVYSVVS